MLRETVLILAFRRHAVGEIGHFVSNIVNLYWNGTLLCLFCKQEQVDEAFR
jgi:hypothetical protein